MINRKIFFDLYKKQLDKDKKLDQKEVNAIDLFLNFVDKQWSEFSGPQWAYIFATTFHETAHTFEPVREAYWMSEAWRKKNFRYYPYYGRGYVQITWKANYQYYANLLGLDLVNNPDITMQPQVAFLILTHGFKYGKFTGRKITDYISGSKKDYVNARRCINGTDKASLIANYAKLFEEIILKSV